MARLLSSVAAFWQACQHGASPFNATATSAQPPCTHGRAADLKPLYRSSSKAALLGQLFERLAGSLEGCGVLPPLEGEEGSEQKPAPQALVW